MSIKAKIFLDSVNPAECRLTTWELTYPRFIHSEVMTHRMLSKNASSSRAIPTAKIIDCVLTDPAMPVFWGKNQSGMQAKVEIAGAEKKAAIQKWLAARDSAVACCRELNALGVHKQIANRVLEPWSHITVVLSGTEFGNFFNLRCQPEAQPEFQALACQMRDLYYSQSPDPLWPGQWHLPLIAPEDETSLPLEDLKKISVGRCARVSYLTHVGRRDVQEDIMLHDRLVANGHMSPFEHVAMSLDCNRWSGNFRGFEQYRKTLFNENRGDYEPLQNVKEEERVDAHAA
jgi:thymidylate synthase ThyX